MFTSPKQTLRRKPDPDLARLLALPITVPEGAERGPWESCEPREGEVDADRLAWARLLGREKESGIDRHAI